MISFKKLPKSIKFLLLLTCYFDVQSQQSNAFISTKHSFESSVSQSFLSLGTLSYVEGQNRMNKVSRSLNACVILYMKRAPAEIIFVHQCQMK